MKLSNFKSHLLILAIVAILPSCKKDSVDLTPPPDNNAAELAKVLKSKAPTFQNFTINAASGGTITTAFGTKFKFPANIFRNPDGSITTGSVEVAVKEIQDASAMILADRPTATSDGKMLESFGEFFIAAQQGANKLNLNKDSAVMVQIPRRPPAGMKEIPMWSGDSSISSTMNGYDYQNNSKTVTTTYYVSKGLDWNQKASSFAFFNSVDNTMDFRLDSLFKWVNCDALYSIPGTKTTVMAYFGNKFNNTTGNNYGGEEPSMLYFKPKGVNSVIKLYNVILTPPEAYQGFHSYQAMIPAGMEATFLAISAKDGKFYAEEKTVTIAEPGAATYVPITFSLQELSSAQLLTLIDDMKSK
ncbi:MAG: hypothetical protein WC716_14730 [Chitinophagaceae bacterium]|jgi:hypothetical protein